jgi:esterase/lipase
MTTLNELVEYHQKLKKMKQGNNEELEKMCRKLLNHTNERLKTFIGMFNSLITEISKLLSREFPNDQTLYTYSNVIPEITSTKPMELISIFILNVYGNDKYRKYIIDGDDKFFLLDDYKHITGSDKNNIQMMFQFKNYWKKLDENNRNFIKTAMKTMVDLSAQYIEKKDDGNKIAVILNSI